MLNLKAKSMCGKLWNNGDISTTSTQNNVNPKQRQPQTTSTQNNVTRVQTRRDLILTFISLQGYIYNACYTYLLIQPILFSLNSCSID